MPIDVSVHASPGWWLAKLSVKLYQRRYSPLWRRSDRLDGFDADIYRAHIRPPLERLDLYARNNPPMPELALKWGVSAREFQRMSRTCWAALVVECVANRMVPNGWRTAADSNRDGDQIAKQVADVSELQLKIQDSNRFMLELGDGYMMTGEPRRNSNIPVITAEDPRQTITAEDPRTGETLASLKVLRDEWTDRDFAYLCIVGAPSVQYVAFTEDKSPVYNSRVFFMPDSWAWDDSRGGASGLRLPPAMDWRSPIVRFANSGGEGEFERHLPLLDRIHDGIFDRIVIGKHQAFRQRALKGLPSVYPADHPQAGEAIEWDKDAFASDPASLWDLPPDVDVWESQPIDLGPLRLANKDDVESLAAVTSTPLYFITPDAASGSAEGATTQRESFSFRVDDRRRRVSAGLARVLSNCFAIMGETDRAKVELIKTTWEPAERYSLLTRTQSATFAKSAGLGQASIYTDVLGYSPDDVPRLEDELASDALFALQNAPAPPAPPVAAPNNPAARPAAAVPVNSAPATSGA